MQYRIPKRIIQTGRSLNQPLRNRAAIASIKLLNSEYEYLFFGDSEVEDFVEQRFPQYLEVFQRFRYPIQRYDFFRYLAVYYYGGFYFDLDLLLASSLLPLLDYGCVFPFERLSVSRFLRARLGMDWQVGNYAFGASAGHPFLDAVIKNCVKAQNDPDWVKPMMRGSPPLIGDESLVLNSTGPGLVSRTLAERQDIASIVTILFPEDVCDLRTWNCFGDFGIHLMDSTWRANRSFLRAKLSDYCGRWIMRQRVRESRKLGKSRSIPAAALHSAVGMVP